MGLKDSSGMGNGPSGPQGPALWVAYVVRDKITGRIQEIAKTPLESSGQRLTRMTPISWGAECSTYVQWAYEVIDMIHPAVTAMDWSIVDCQ
jgi:hypothetical protein